MGYHQLISYSTTQTALIYPLLNHKLNLLPPKQHLKQKCRTDYQPQNPEIPSEKEPMKRKLGIRKNQLLPGMTALARTTS